MGKGSSGTNTVTNNSSPPANVMNAYNTALNMGQNAASAPLQQYSGQTIAGFSPDQASAMNTVDSLQGVANPYINQAAGLIGQSTQPLWNNVQQFSPSAVQQYMSPYTQNVLNTTVAQEQNQDAQQQSALQGNAISQGAWGGDRAGVASAVLAGQQALANNQTNANIENTGYNTGLSEFNTQQQAQLGANEANQYLAAQGAYGMGNLGNEALSTGLQGASAQLQSGALQQQLGQEELNYPYEQYQAQQAYPFQTAQYYANIAEGIGSGAGGTSSTTSPSPSTLSQIGGLGMTGLGIIGGTGGFGSSGWLTSMFSPTTAAAAAKRGGGIRGYDNGGGIPNVPDVSISIVPTPQQIRGNMGPPRPPAAAKPQETGLQDFMGGLSMGKGFGGMNNNSAPTQAPQTPINLSNSPSPSVTTGMTNQNDMNNFLGPQTPNQGFGTFSATPQEFDDGGTVGGMTPMTASTATQTPMQQNYNSSYQNMTPEQLQMILMRLPPGSQQSKSAAAVLQQKRMMPNVGTQAQGGFNAQQQQQQPLYGGYKVGGGLKPRGYDDGGDVVTDDSGNDVPLSSLQGTPSAPQTTELPTTAPTADGAAPQGPNKADPWMALTAAGLGMMAGQSPYAGVNIGEGGLLGLKEFSNEKKQADTENYQQGELGIRKEEAQARAEELANQAARFQKELSKKTVEKGPDGGLYLIDPYGNSPPQPVQGFGTNGTQGTPTGQPITPAMSKIDQANLENMNKKYNPAAAPDMDQTAAETLRILDNYNLNPGSGLKSEANKYANMVGMNFSSQNGGILSPDDYARVTANMNSMKAQAMGNAKNIRNLREFNIITSPANVFGGGNISPAAQISILQAAVHEPETENQFFNDYYDTYHTLDGSQAVYNQYQKENSPVVRDKNGNLTGVNQNYFSPANIHKYVQNAPSIYQKMMSGNTAQPEQQNSGALPNPPTPNNAGASYPQPSQQAIQYLNQHPDSAPQFEQRYGVSAKDFLR